MKSKTLSGYSGILLLLSCVDGSTDSDDRRDAVSDLAGARSVWVANLTRNEPTTPREVLLASAVFEEASEADALRITSLVSDEGNYMTTANACFNNDAAIRFHFEDSEVVFAVIGFTCWNVSFVPGDDGQVVPQSDYMNPQPLKELVSVLREVLPSLDISGLED